MIIKITPDIKTIEKNQLFYSKESGRVLYVPKDEHFDRESQVVKAYCPKEKENFYFYRDQAAHYVIRVTHLYAPGGPLDLYKV